MQYLRNLHLYINNLGLAYSFPNHIFIVSFISAISSCQKYQPLYSTRFIPLLLFHPLSMLLFSFLPFMNYHFIQPPFFHFERYHFRLLFFARVLVLCCCFFLPYVISCLVPFTALLCVLLSNR